MEYICSQTAIIHFISALIIPLFALKFVLSWSDIKNNLVFIYLSILGCMVPYLILSFFGYELPTIIGGLVGLVFTTFLASRNIGLFNPATKEEVETTIGVRQLVKASFPLWGTVVILLLTRIDELGIKGFLLSHSPALEMNIGGLGSILVSSSLVLGLENVLGTPISWYLETLYIPALSPFILVSCLSLALFKVEAGVAGAVIKESAKQMVKPILALLGALVFVKLLMAGGDKSTAAIIGKGLADLAGPLWIHFAAFLGAFGAFFSGSNTVSNLTFGGIQVSIAQSLGLNIEKILSLQTAGGSIGTMVSISNIVAICTVLGLDNKEGVILKKTIWPMIIYCLIASFVVYLSDYLL